MRVCVFVETFEVYISLKSPPKRVKYRRYILKVFGKDGLMVKNIIKI